MTPKFYIRSEQALRVVIFASIQFVVLTFLAMLLYPGGSAFDTKATGYAFTNNFFSDLGLTQTYSGHSNIVSSILFLIATSLAGIGVVMFFLVYPGFFRKNPRVRILSWSGSIFGILTGLCFVGVAFTPANLYGHAHGLFAIWAFRFFPLAVLPYIAAILLEKDYPNRYALVFAGFAALLVGYLILITKGPSMFTPAGWKIQAIGQKLIVYATIISVFISAHGARKILKRGDASRIANS